MLVEMRRNYGGEWWMVNWVKGKGRERGQGFLDNKQNIRESRFKAR